MGRYKLNGIAATEAAGQQKTLPIYFCFYFTSMCVLICDKVANSTDPTRKPMAIQYWVLPSMTLNDLEH